MLMHNDDNRDGKFLSQVNYKRLVQELLRGGKVPAYCEDENIEI